MLAPLGDLARDLTRLNRRVQAVIYTLAAALVALVVLPAIIPHEAPSGLVLQGVELGAVNGLMALGLVLTYRSTRVINFSYAALGGVAATVGVMLFVVDHWNWFACIAITLLIGAVLGFATEVLMVRPLFNSPRMILTVATIGMGLGLGGIQYLLPGWMGGPGVVGGLSTPLSKAHLVVHPVLFNGNDLLIACVVPVVLFVLGWFLLRTDYGIAVRSVADNADRAKLLGIPIRKLSTLVWTLAGVLAALTVMVAAPGQGLVISVAAGPQLLLPALAAAVIARMESLPIAFGAGVGLGIVNQIVLFNVSDQSVSTVVFFAVILVALLLQPRKGGRAEASGETWTATAVFKPIPAVLRELPEVRFGRLAIGAVVTAVVLVLPFVLGLSLVLQFTFALIYGMIAVSLLLLSGWGGNISLGQFALAGVGAVMAGDLMSKAHLDYFLALAAAGAAGAALALVVGLPALRIRGEFLAVTTMALALAVNFFFINPANFPNQLPGSITPPVLWRRFDLSSIRANYFFILGLLVLTILFVKGIRRARAGRVILATRDNERAAAAMSVPTVRVMLTGFILAGAVAGIAGALYSTSLRSVGYDSFDPAISILVFVMAVIGGLNSISGVLISVAAFQWLSYELPQTGIPGQYLFVITGFGLVLTFIFSPGGTGQGLQQARDRILKAIAKRRGIVVPSLTADSRVDRRDGAPREEVMMTGALSGSEGEHPGAAVGEFAGGDLGGSAQWDPGESVVAEATEVVTQAAAVQGPITTPMLSCHGVEISYGPVQVLFGVDLEVNQGEIVALLGTNGAGKSTLLKGICGLVKVTEGGVAIDGDDMTRTSPGAMARKSVSLMPGGRGIFPTLTVAENLRLATWLMRAEKHRAELARQQALELFPVLGMRLGQAAGDLSGGEQQMLSLAMALMVRPRLLMIDELSLGLAPTIVSQLLEVVRMLHETGTTIVVVEQSVNVALELAERAVFLEKGEVRFSGPTADLLARPDILRSVFIAGANATTGYMEQGPTETRAEPAHAQSTSTPSSTSEMAGTVSALETNGHGGPSTDSPVILECRQVSKNFGGIRAVDRVDIQLHTGEILGLIGHNGAGKTTLFDMISGFLPLDGGRILLGNMDVGTWSAPMRAVTGIGRTFQEARLFPTLTVEETIAVALERHLASRDLIAAGLSLPASLDSEAEAAERVITLIEMMGLSAYSEKLVGELSTGTRRIVELACVLAQDPAVVLLDEPSGGVAQRETEALGPLLRRVQERSGCSMLVIEHDMPLLSAICDRMIALELGQVIATGTPAEVLEHPLVIESYLGTDESTIRRSGARLG